MKKIISIVAISTICIVGGCSKKTEHMETEAVAEAASDAVAASADSSATAADASISSKDAATDQVENPEQLLAVEQSSLEKKRKLVKTSQLSFEVEELQKTTQAIEKKLLEVNGYIEIKQVDYQIQDQTTRQKLDGTIDIFEKVKPVSQLTIRIPNENVTTFLNSLLPLIKNFNQQYYEAKRYELKLLEEKINTSQQSYGESRAVSNQMQRLTQQEVNDRLAYSTISLDYYQAAQVRQSKDINITRIASIQSDPFLVRVWASIKMGFIAVREVFVWLIMLWPLYLIAALGFWIYRKFVYSKKKDFNSSL